jgi:hypothetical protein
MPAPLSAAMERTRRYVVALGNDAKARRRSVSATGDSHSRRAALHVPAAFIRCSPIKAA